MMPVEASFSAKILTIYLKFMSTIKNTFFFFHSNFTQNFYFIY